MTAHADEPRSLDYSSGQLARSSWELWLILQQGPYRDGALWGAQHRGDRPDRGCPGDHGEPFATGCGEARARLAPIDAQRRASADYRAGFNARADDRPADAALPAVPTFAPTFVPAFVPPRPPPPRNVPAPASFEPGRVYRTDAHLIAFGCRAADKAAALGQRMPPQGSLAMLAAEALAYDCFALQPGFPATYIRTDPETGALAVAISPPLFVLGHGKIDALWIAANMFLPNYGVPPLNWRGAD